LEVFFDNPLPESIGFHLREISTSIKLAPKSVKLYLVILEKEKLVVKKILHKYPVYFANRDNAYFKFLKKLNMLSRIKESGLLDYLDEKCMPDSIILFGSASKGEDIKSSDIDLFLGSKEKDLDLLHYEKKLHRSISLFFEADFDRLSNELKQNIINGDKLSGFLKVKF